MRVEGKLQWVHSVSTELDTHYHVDPKRGRLGMEKTGLLESFRGTLMHDCWSAYFSWEKCQHALCNAHLLRELQFFEKKNQSWALKMAAFLKSTHRDPGNRCIEEWLWQYELILLLRFLTNPSVPFTNNRAEQDNRMIKVRQKTSGTFSSIHGARMFCRIRSFISCARKRQRSVFQSLRNAFLQSPDFCSNGT